MKTKNILLVGVGGQGIILASKIISNTLINAGYDVKMSEVHGMAQRGGAVTTQVRFGDKVHSPIIGKGEADILVAFEKMEAERWLEYLKPDGLAVVNDYEIYSAPILSGKKNYPENIAEDLSEKVKLVMFNASEIAENLGNIKAQNIVITGAMAKNLQLENLDWKSSIEAFVKPKFVELNIDAFNAGLKKSFE